MDYKFKIGDKVLRRNMRQKTRKGNKGEDRWLGPYVIVELSNTSCLLKNEHGKVLKTRISLSQLKPFLQQGQPEHCELEISEQEEAETQDASEQEKAETQDTSEQEEAETQDTSEQEEAESEQEEAETQDTSEQEEAESEQEEAETQDTSEQEEAETHNMGTSEQKEVVELEKVAQTKQAETVYWVQSLGLSEEHRRKLIGGDWLDDVHIYAASTLLKKQYPHQNGLQYTQGLVKNLYWQCSNVDFIQILHVSGNHWVCASNSLSPPGVCDVYDSMPSSHSSVLARQVAAMMKSQASSFRLRQVNVQMQNGTSDCGLFAVAFAVSLCGGKDPHVCSYDQGQMRHHLYQCLEKGKLTEFPATKKLKPKRYTRRVKSTRPVQVYCTCRLPWDKTRDTLGDLAQCGKCSEWFHQTCKNIPNIMECQMRQK